MGNRHLSIQEMTKVYMSPTVEDENLHEGYFPNDTRYGESDYGSPSFCSEPTTPPSDHLERANSRSSASGEDRKSRKRKRVLENDEPDTVMSRLQRTRRSLVEDPVVLGLLLRKCWSENAAALLRGYK